MPKNKLQNQNFTLIHKSIGDKERDNNYKGEEIESFKKNVLLL